ARLPVPARARPALRARGAQARGQSFLPGVLHRHQPGAARGALAHAAHGARQPHSVRRGGAGRVGLAGDRALGAAGDVLVGQLRLQRAHRAQAMKDSWREPLLYWWAQTLLFFGASRRALPVLEEVVALNPKRHDAWNVLGYLHAQKG